MRPLSLSNNDILGLAITRLERKCSATKENYIIQYSRIFANGYSVSILKQKEITLLRTQESLRRWVLDVLFRQ